MNSQVGYQLTSPSPPSPSPPPLENREETTSSEINDPSFCEKSCWCYFCGCNLFIILGLLISLIFVILISPIGLILAALTPGVVILYLCYSRYKNQITIGQMAGYEIHL